MMFPVPLWGCWGARAKHVVWKLSVFSSSQGCRRCPPPAHSQSQRGVGYMGDPYAAAFLSLPYQLKIKSNSGQGLLLLSSSLCLLSFPVTIKRK